MEILITLFIILIKLILASLVGLGVIFITRKLNLEDLYNPLYMKYRLLPKYCELCMLGWASIMVCLYLDYAIPAGGIFAKNIIINVLIGLGSMGLGDVIDDLKY